MMLTAALFSAVVSSLFFTRPGFGHEVQLKPVERREISRSIEAFRLTDQNGQRFEFSKVRGKVAVVGFAYTTCPDVCPLITGAMRQVQIDLSQRERENSYFLTVTTDPEIDSPPVLAAYARRYGAELSGWSFLTGDRATLEPVWKSFGVGVVRKAKGLVDHTPLIAIVDRQGMLRVVYIGSPADVRSVLRDMRRLMTEKR